MMGDSCTPTLPCLITQLGTQHIDHCHTYRMKVPFHVDSPLLLLLGINATPMGNPKKG